MSQTGDEHSVSSGRLRAVMAALVVFAVTAFIVWHGTGLMRARETERLRAEYAEEIHPYGAALGLAIADHVAAVEALAGFVAAEQGTGDGLGDAGAFADGLFARNEGLRNLEIAPGGVVEYVYPEGSWDAALGDDLESARDPEIASDVERAIGNGATTLSGPLDLAGEGRGMIAWKAVYIPEGEYWGLTAGIIELDAILLEAGLDHSLAGREFALVDTRGNVVTGSAQVVNDEPVLHEVPVADGVWLIAVQPAEGWDEIPVPGEALVWVLGLALGVLGGAAVYLLLSSQTRLHDRLKDRTAELASSNAHLGQQVGALLETQEALATSEERFRMLFDLAPTAMAIAYRGRLELANRAFTDLIGLESPQQAQGRHVLDDVHPDNREEIATRASSRFEGQGASDHYETALISSSGEKIPIDVNLTTFEIDDEQRTLAMLTDLRPRMATEQALQDSLATYRALFEHSPTPQFEEDFSAAKEYLDGLGVECEQLDAHLREHPEHLEAAVGLMYISRVNLAGVQLMRASAPEEILGPMASILCAETERVLRAELVVIARGDTEFRDTSELWALNGERIVADISWQVPMGSEKTFDCVYVSVIERTREHELRRELEEYRDNLELLVTERTVELATTNEQLVEATQAKDRFLAAMSHELRTPLNSIIGFSGIMLQELPGSINAEQRKQLEMVRNAGQHLLAIVNQILDLARIAAGRAQIRYMEFDAGELAEMARAEIAHLARDKGLATSCRIELSDPVIRSDQGRVRQILLNLLSNSVKFTASGEIQLIVEDAGPGRVCFRVRDTGPGIPRQERESVFEAFEQLPVGDQAKPEGTGLGLSISRDLAALLGGTLELSENTDGGTEFVLCLPREAPDSHDA